MNEERPIERLLRRYAKKRRADAGLPVELHPATRRLLQGEVGRRFRNAATGGAPLSFAQWLKGWQSQLAWAVPLLLLVAVGAWLLLDRPESKQLALGPASNQSAVSDGSRATKVEQPAPGSLPPTPEARPLLAIEKASTEFRTAKATPPSPTPVPVRAPDQQIISLAGTAGKNVAPARSGFKEITQTESLGVAPSPAAHALSAEATSANQRLNESNTRSFATKTPTPGAPLLDKAVATATPGRSDRLERDQAQTYSQSFVNRVSEPLKQKTAKTMAPKPITPVLANFRVEQTGRQLRVVDGDGSMYLGETDVSPMVWGAVGGQKDQVVQSFKKSDGKLNQLPAAAASIPPQQRQSNFYRVTGTNRTLNQTVVFTWSFVELTNAALIAESRRISGDLSKDVKKLPTQFPALLQNSFITGRAQFGTGKEIEINAVPVSP